MYFLIFIADESRTRVNLRFKIGYFLAANENIYLHAYIHTYIHTYIPTYIHTHTHTHTHTQTGKTFYSLFF